ncbi:MAG: hypothetical protein ACI89L_001878 [Phycisphaerales bacterium]
MTPSVGFADTSPVGDGGGILVAAAGNPPLYNPHMITRKIGKLVRGKATPFQIGLACILGGLIGATPGFGQGPGLVLTLLGCLLVLNANLGVAAIVASLTKLVSLAAMPVQFKLGQALLDGPTEGLFKAMINTPVLAWFGFEYYAVTGGIVLGLLVGVFFAAMFISVLGRVRRKLAAMEAMDPEERGRAQKTIEDNKVARFFIWVFIGKKSKKSYEELASKKIGNPIRIVGVLIVILFAVFIGILFMFFQEPLITASVKSGLQNTNGATVDMDSADVDLAAGNLTITGLAMADPENLSTDIFRAQTLTADIGAKDLLTRRIGFDLIEISDASSGEARTVPGVLTRPRPEKTTPPEGEGKTLDDYMAQAEQWKERLGQAREWLDKAQGDTAEDPNATDAQNRESYKDRLRRQIEAMGYTRVRANHLIDGAPTVVIHELVIDGLSLKQLEGEILDVHGVSLATQPNLLETGRPVLDITSRSGNLSASLAVAAQPGEQTTLNATRLKVPGDTLGAMLSSISGQPPISGGEVDLNISAMLNGPMLNGTLNTTIHGSTIQIAGNSTQVDSLMLPIGLTGPIDSPRIDITDEALKQALISAGKAELANQIGGEAGKLIDDAIGDNEALDDVKDAISDGLGGLLGGKKKDGG